MVAPVLVSFGLVGGPGDAEVDEVGKVVRGHQDVRGLDVAMYQPDAVCSTQRSGDLFDDGTARSGVSGPLASSCWTVLPSINRIVT